jgi:hypothetical protein
MSRQNSKWPEYRGEGREGRDRLEWMDGWMDRWNTTERKRE